MTWTAEGYPLEDGDPRAGAGGGTSDRAAGASRPPARRPDPATGRERHDPTAPPWEEEPDPRAVAETLDLRAPTRRQPPADPGPDGFEPWFGEDELAFLEPAPRPPTGVRPESTWIDRRLGDDVEPPGPPWSPAPASQPRPEPPAAPGAPPPAAAPTGGPARRAGKAVVRRLDTLFSEGGPGFRLLALSHACSTAGDTVVAIALAQTLFFAVPSSEARSNVVGYLLLTVAPFAVIGPLLGLVFDRRGAGRSVLVGSSVLRLVVTALLVWQVESLWLFPLAFAILVFSRVHGISRSSLLPLALDQPVTLVSANARLAQIGVLAGAVVGPVGAGIVQVGGPPWGLALAAAVFLAATLFAFRLPVVEEGDPDPDPARRREVAKRARWSSRLPRQVQIAQLATAAVRFLNGFLVLLLAFALRDVDAPLLDFGAVLAAAGGGYALASALATPLERRLREEPMVVAALAVEAAAAFVAAQWFGLAAAAALSLAAGFAWGTAKFAFDGLLQATVPPEGRGRAFTRTETAFQLAWVVGALLPTGITLSAELGLAAAGIAALVAQTIYVSRLLQRAGVGPDPRR